MQRASGHIGNNFSASGSGTSGESEAGESWLAKVRRFLFAAQPEQTQEARGGILGPLLVALVMGLAIANFPRHPYIVDDALSEKAVLNYAHEHDLKFGSQIVFTYGPLGYLSSRYFFEHAAGLRMASELAISFVTSLGVCLLARRLSRLWKWALVVVALFILSNVDPRADLVLYVALLCWGLLCVVESAQRLALAIGGFCFVAVFGMLIKGNFLVAGGLCAAAIVTDFLVQRRFSAAGTIVVGLGGGFLAGWLLAGQHWGQIGPFLVNSFSIMGNYDQTVGLEGLEILQRRGVEASLLAVVAALAHGLSSFGPEVRARRVRRAVITGWWLALMFLIWKHAFVRADLYHAGFCFGFLPIFVIAIAALPRGAGSAVVCGKCVAGACCALSLITLEQLFFSSLKGSLIQPYHSIVDNLKAVANPASYRAEMGDLLKAAKRTTELPELGQKMGRSTVDVFGQEQAYALFNGLILTPRPVFQSYLAFNTRLMRLNQDFYLSDSAPEYVLFHLAPIDRKFPPLEDGWLLRHLLLNYVPIGSELQFLLLKRKSSVAPKLKLLIENSARIGERIELRRFGETNLWMEIEVLPTWKGRLREFLSKPPKLRLAVWVNTPEERLSRAWAPAPMLAAGFLASPLLLRNEDFPNAANSNQVTHPDSYSVHCDPGSEGQWQPVLRYRIYRIENALAAERPPP